MRVLTASVHLWETIAYSLQIGYGTRGDLTRLGLAAVHVTTAWGHGTQRACICPLLDASVRLIWPKMGLRTWCNHHFVSSRSYPQKLDLVLLRFSVRVSLCHNHMLTCSSTSSTPCLLFSTIRRTMAAYRLAGVLIAFARGSSPLAMS